MAQWLIPTFPDPFYTQTTTLEGVAYVLHFAYNARERCWYLTIRTPNGVDLARGIKVKANSFLLGDRTEEGLPPGELVAFTNSADDSPPDLEELGEGLRCELLYLDTAELAEMNSEAST
jgi:hypothetical protein